MMPGERRGGDSLIVRMEDGRRGLVGDDAGGDGLGGGVVGAWAVASDMGGPEHSAVVVTLAGCASRSA